MVRWCRKMQAVDTVLVDACRMVHGERSDFATIAARC